MKRTNVLRAASIAAFTAAAFAMAPTSTTQVTASENGLHQLVEFHVLDQGAGMALLEVVSDHSTAGHNVMIHTDGIPVGGMTLMHGSNMVMVPGAPSSVFVAEGGSIEAAVAWDDDPGQW